MKHEFRIIQDGLNVAGSSAEDRLGAFSSIRHYASLYASEGDLEIQEKINGRWKTIEKVSQYD